MDSSNVSCKIKKASEKDIEVILELVESTWPEGFAGFMEREYGPINGRPWRQWTAKDVKRYFRNNPDSVFVTEIEGNIAGFFSYSLDYEKKVGEVGYNMVVPEYRGQGIGSFQIKELLQMLRDRGMRYAKVITGLNDAHKPARKLYERAGFKEGHRSVQYGMEL